MASLFFEPTELLREISALRDLAEAFIDPTSSYRLDELKSEIEGLCARKGKLSLTIPQTRPLKTRVSIGEFEPSHKRSKRQVYGSITGIWELSADRYNISKLEQPSTKTKDPLLVGFSGKASTVFLVTEVSGKVELAQWKMELGSPDAPGCFFHTFSSADQSFPVPRHPNLFPTPMSAIDFALGELFQTAWEKAVSGSGHAPSEWRTIQVKRLERLLSWQMLRVKETTSSPWCTLKLAKPDKGLFL